jgi:hypothetical protein
MPHVDASRLNFDTFRFREDKRVTTAARRLPRIGFGRFGLAWISAGDLAVSGAVAIALRNL